MRVSVVVLFMIIVCSAGLARGGTTQRIAYQFSHYERYTDHRAGTVDVNQLYYEQVSDHVKLGARVLRNNLGVPIENHLQLTEHFIRIDGAYMRGRYGLGVIGCQIQSQPAISSHATKALRSFAIHPWIIGDGWEADLHAAAAKPSAREVAGWLTKYGHFQQTHPYRLFLQTAHLVTTDEDNRNASTRNRLGAGIFARNYWVNVFGYASGQYERETERPVWSFGFGRIPGDRWSEGDHLSGVPGLLVIGCLKPEGDVFLGALTLGPYSCITREGVGKTIDEIVKHSLLRSRIIRNNVINSFGYETVIALPYQGPLTLTVEHSAFNVRRDVVFVDTNVRAITSRSDFLCHRLVQTYGGVGYRRVGDIITDPITGQMRAPIHAYATVTLGTLFPSFSVNDTVFIGRPYRCGVETTLRFAHGCDGAAIKIMFML
ncbi:MAG: hypothetical protein V1778_02580 [bacterium]